MKQIKNNFSQYLGLSLSVPIFNRFSTRNSIRSAELNRETQKLQLENTKKTLYKEIQQVYYNALAAKSKLKNYKTYVLMGDGECNEGTVWEAAMAASQYKLNNLIAIIDRNRRQSDGESIQIMDMGDIGAKWLSFGWEFAEIDGHNIAEIYDALKFSQHLKKPYLIIANTIKGKGISFMENNDEWHHNILTKLQFEKAIQELS